MKKYAPNHRLMTVTIALIAILLLLAPAGRRRLVSAADQLERPRPAGREKLAQIAAELTAKDAHQFRRALDNLAALDEPGVHAVWQTALRSEDPILRQQAFRDYQNVRLDLERKQFIPRLARLHASPDEIKRAARAIGVDVDVWSAASRTASSGAPAWESVAAAPPYLLDAMQRAAVPTEVLYDSIADFQKAEAAGEELARGLAAARLAAKAETPMQVRIAVVDLSQTRPPWAGYSDWLGDHENVIRRNDAFLAYLDVFASDGSPASVNEHLRERYNRRGYQLAGFYTAAEFAGVVGRYFPGESFDFSDRGATGGVRPQAAEGRFHSYEETLAEFTKLAQDHPGIASLVTLGRTYENRSIFALKISKDAAVDDSSKFDVLITGNHHAREWISIEPPVYFANRLINGYATDATIRHLVDRLQIWIVPIVNPDGLAYSQASPNDQLDAERLWRKNRRPISVGDCNSGTGVDLNRNYGYQWRLRGDEPCPNTSDDNGGSDNPNSEIFRGAEPESEQEVRAVKSLLDDPARHFRLQLDYHNFSQLILYPWSFQRFAAPDAGTLAALAQKMSDEIRRVGGKAYRAQTGNTLYTSTGTSTDYSYSVNQVAAPFVIEMRPDCCDFNVPESQIETINQENWAGALAMLKWAAAPPFLRAVRAYQSTAGGNFNKLVYSAEWVEAEGGRRLEVDTRFPGLEVGPLQLHLQFSKPMDAALNPRVTMGRNEEINELTAQVLNAVEGWQKTVYENDTWLGEVIIPQDGNETDVWRLAVAATDTVPFRIDGKPQTVARYGVGTNRWQDYEDASDDTSAGAGGTDIEHVLAPSIRSDFLNLLVASPAGGERLAAGDPFTFAWTVPKDTNFIPVQQDVRLSTDSGSTFAVIGNVGGNVERAQVTLPNIATTTARVRIFAREGIHGNTIYGDSHADFTIGKNVGAGVEIAFVSAVRSEQNWTDAPADNPEAPLAGSLRLTLTVKITNRSSVAIANPFLRLAELSRDNVLLSRDRKSKQHAGAHQSLDVGSDNLLTPGESIEVRLVVGAYNQKKFFMSTYLYGVPSGGSITPAEPVEIWRGKLKSRVQ